MLPSVAREMFQILASKSVQECARTYLDLRNKMGDTRRGETNGPFSHSRDYFRFRGEKRIVAVN